MSDSSHSSGSPDRAMSEEQEIERLLDGTTTAWNQEWTPKAGRWNCQLVRGIAVFCIFLLGVAIGWYLGNRSGSNRYAYDTVISDAQALAKPIHRTTLVPAGPGNYSDPFRRPPSKELDDAWENLYTNSLLLITEADVRRLGREPREQAHLTESFEYGDKKYLAKFDHIHTVHCLNLIRKWVHSDHYFPHGKPKTLGRIHVDHCIRSILDNLLCHVDYGMFTYQWVEGEPLPIADFKVDRQCRNYDALLDYAKKNRVDVDGRVIHLPRPKDAFVVSQDPAIEKSMDEFERTHPNHPTRQQRTELHKKLYDAGIREWQQTGRIPSVKVDI